MFKIYIFISYFTILDNVFDRFILVQFYFYIYIFILNACTVNSNRFISFDTLLKCFGELSQQLIYISFLYCSKKILLNMKLTVISRNQ